MSLGVVNTSNGGVAMGIGGQTINSVTAVDQAGAPIKFAGLTEPGQTQHLTDFHILVY